MLTEITGDADYYGGGYWNAKPGSPIRWTGDGAYCCRAIGKESGASVVLSASVSDKSNWTHGSIQFVDASGNVISGMAKTGEVSSQYREYKLAWPMGADKVYINSATGRKPIIYKKGKR